MEGRGDTIEGGMQCSYSYFCQSAKFNLKNGHLKLFLRCVETSVACGPGRKDAENTTEGAINWIIDSLLRSYLESNRGVQVERRSTIGVTD